MLFVIGGELREVRFPNNAIKDADWIKFQQLSGLPLKARFVLNEYIGFCRELRADATRKFGGRWFNKLSAVIQAELGSKRTLDNVIAESEFFDALAMGLDGQERIPVKELKVIRKWLKHVSAEKQRSLDWYKKALQRVHHGRTGQKTGRTALVALVQAINDCLLSYTSNRISTGSGDLLEFVVKVCVIAFPELLDPDRKEKVVSKPYDRAERKVRKAIEQVLKHYLAGENSEKLNDWQHLMPDWKPATKLVLEGKGVQIYFCKGRKARQLLIKSNSSVIFPLEPFVSDKVAARQSKMKPRIKLRLGSEVKSKSTRYKSVPVTRL